MSEVVMESSGSHTQQIELLRSKFGLPVGVVAPEAFGDCDRDVLERFAAEIWNLLWEVSAGTAGSLTSEHLSSKRSSFHGTPKPPSSPKYSGSLRPSFVEQPASSNSPSPTEHLPMSRSISNVQAFPLALLTVDVKDEEGNNTADNNDNVTGLDSTVRPHSATSDKSTGCVRTQQSTASSGKTEDLVTLVVPSEMEENLTCGTPNVQQGEISELGESGTSAASYRPQGYRRPQLHHTAQHDVDDLGIETINQYVLQEELGRGAHGVVRKVIDMDTGTTAAVKIIKRDRFRKSRTVKDSPWGSVRDAQLSTTADRSGTAVTGCSSTSDDDEQLQREVAIMKKIANAHIVRMIEAIDDRKSNSIYLVMEYIPGGPILRKVPVASGTAETSAVEKVYEPLPSDKVRAYTRQIVSALLYLHNKSIVHHDIKIENILLDPETDTVYLADFGVSSFVEGGVDGAEVAQGPIGTPLYMAPEAVSGQATTGMPGDVWALGVTVFAMATGCLPFTGSTVAEVLEQIVRHEPQYPNELDEECRALIQSMLKKNPDERVTVKELRANSYIRSAAFRHQAALMSPTKNDDLVVTAEDLSTALKPCLPRQVSRAQLASLMHTPLPSRTPTPSAREGHRAWQ